jgi:hypothetical protein
MKRGAQRSVLVAGVAVAVAALFGAGRAAADQTCTIGFGAKSAVTLGSMHLQVGYPAGSAFAGAGVDVSCLAVAGASPTTSFFDDDPARSLELFISGLSVAGPATVLECVWQGAAQPQAGDFVVTVVSAKAPGGTALAPASVGVTSVRCGVILTTTTTTTTTVGGGSSTTSTSIRHGGGSSTTVTVPDTTTTTLGVFQCGDADGNGLFNATDALIALRAAVRLVTCAPSVCDVDGSGGVSATDALQLLRVAVNLIARTELLCPE